MNFSKYGNVLYESCVFCIYRIYAIYLCKINRIMTYSKWQQSKS